MQQVELYVGSTDLTLLGGNPGLHPQCWKTYLLKLSLWVPSEVSGCFFKKYSLKTDLKICLALKLDKLMQKGKP